MLFDDLIFKEGDSFYIDLDQSEFDFGVEIGDTIRFIYEGKKYFGKVEYGKYSAQKIHDVVISKEIKE